MAIQYEGIDISLIAGEAMTAKQYHFVRLSDVHTVVGCDAATDIPVGILQNAPASGQAAVVRIAGVSKFYAAGSTTAGNAIGADSSGHGAVYAAGSATTSYIQGLALDSPGAAGRIGALLLRPIARGA